LHVLAALGAMFITALALSALGIVIALRMTDFENFGTIQNFITQPLYLFSGAIFPTRGVPGWLSALLFLNPLTYGVNAIRGALLGYNVSEVPRDIVALLGVTVVFLGIALMLARGEA
ncbi:MAG TPA: ABC transporter permease, partial [Ktedonobacterales bacterium]